MIASCYSLPLHEVLTNVSVDVSDTSGEILDEWIETFQREWASKWNNQSTPCVTWTGLTPVMATGAALTAKITHGRKV